MDDEMVFCELCGTELSEYDAEYVDENGHECVYCETCWDFRRENGYAREPWETADGEESEEEEPEEEL